MFQCIVLGHHCQKVKKTTNRFSHLGSKLTPEHISKVNIFESTNIGTLLNPNGIRFDKVSPSFVKQCDNNPSLCGTGNHVSSWGTTYASWFDDGMINHEISLKVTMFLKHFCWFLVIKLHDIWWHVTNYFREVCPWKIMNGCQELSIMFPILCLFSYY